MRKLIIVLVWLFAGWQLATASTQSAYLDASVSGVWSDPGNATSSTDGSCAASGRPSLGGLYHTWKLNSGAFSIPAGATIDGLEITIRYAADGDWLSMYLSPDNSAWGTGKSFLDTGGGPTACPSTDTLSRGSSTDLWGNTWTAATINDDLYVLLSADKGGDGDEGNNIYVDSVQVTVHYQDPPNTAPVGGYTADNVIPSAQVTQATNGSGLVTINWKARDDQADDVTLKSFEYSVNGGTDWNAPTNGDASASLSANWDDNGGSDWSSATTFASATAHSFTFNTKHADVTGLDGVDQSDVRIRFTLNDGASDSAAPATSESFQVDNLAPTAAITEGAYDADTDTLTMTGANFLTIASASTDVKSYVHWSRFTWDINGDNATTANITFDGAGVSSLTVTNDTTLTLVFTSGKGTSIEATTGYGDNGGFDTLDVLAETIEDAFGNAPATAAATDARLFIGAPQLTIVKSSTVVSDPIKGATNPLRIPGAIIEFTVIVTNNGDGSPDTDSVVPADNIDSSTLAFDVTTGVTFTDGASSSGLSLGTVVYSDDLSPGPYVYDYTPSPDGDGFDGNITSVKIPTTGRFGYGSVPAESFTVRFRARIK